MRLRDIEILLAVAQLRSFTKAAEKLCLTQPAVSQSVKRIEDEFGTAVFIRTKTTVETSEEGHKAIKALTRMLDIYLSGFKHQQATRHIKIGLSTLLYNIDMAPVIANLRAIGIDQVEIEVGPSERLAGRSDLDVAIVSSRGQSGGDRMIVMAGCWLGKDTGVQIRFKTEYEIWGIDSSRSGRNSLPQHKIIEVGDFGYAYQLAMRGIGVTPSAVAVANDDLLRNAVSGLPSLPNIYFDVVTEDVSIAQAIRESLTVSSPKLAGAAARSPQAPAPGYWQRPAVVADLLLMQSKLQTPDLRAL
jgi:DNA-binding MarR family transcriptional regulator